MARDFDPLNPEKYDPNQFPALKPPPRAAVGAVSTPTVTRTVPTQAKPALVPPATFQGANLEVPTQAKPLAYQAGQAIPKLVRTARAIGSGVVDAASAASDVMSYPGRKVVNDVQQVVAGATGSQAPAPATLLRPNAAPVVAAAPTLAPAGTTMPRTKGSVMRDGRSAAAAVAAAPAPAAAPAAAPAPDTTAAPAPAAAPVVRAAPTTALDGGGTFNGRPVAELLRNPRNPISIVPSGQMPAAMTPAAAGLSPQQLGLTLPARTAPAATMDRSGTFNGQSITAALRGVTNPASNVGASPNVPVAAPAEPAAYVTAPPQAGAPPPATAPVLTRRAFRSPDAMSKVYDKTASQQFTKDVASRIDSMLFRNSFAAGRGSRGARANEIALAGILAQMAGGGNQAVSNMQMADDKNSTEREIAGANNASASQVNAANNAAESQIAALQERSAARRAAAMQQPIVGEDGTLFTREGAVATPLTTPDGKPVRAAPNSDISGKKAVHDGLYKQRAVLLQAGLNPDAQKAALDAFDASPAGQQLAQLQMELTGGSASPALAAAPEAGAVDGGYRFKGGNPADPANWEKAQ